MECVKNERHSYEFKVKYSPTTSIANLESGTMNIELFVTLNKSNKYIDNRLKYSNL